VCRVQNTTCPLGVTRAVTVIIGNLKSIPEIRLTGSSAGSSQSTEQSSEDLPLETRHVVDEQSEHIKDSSIYLVDHSQTTTVTLSSLSHSNKTIA